MRERMSPGRLGRSAVIAAMLAATGCTASRDLPSGPPQRGPSGMELAGARGEFERLRDALAADRGFRLAFSESCATAAGMSPQDRRFIGAVLAVPEDEARAALCDRFVAAIEQGRLGFDHLAALRRSDPDPAAVGEVVRIIVETRPAEVSI